MSLTSDIPWAAQSPPWSGPRPGSVEAAGGTYGTLIATPGARGSWVLHHDPAERWHVMTLLDGSQPESVEAYGRRFLVEYRA